jgi:hypothetical protein
MTGTAGEGKGGWSKDDELAMEWREEIGNGNGDNGGTYGIRMQEGRVRRNLESHKKRNEKQEQRPNGRIRKGEVALSLWKMGRMGLELAMALAFTTSF